ncbi:uncharacterized protein LOC126424806 isoform X1 [Schistocerca serialis cubense]|uniref:uncharacterized protein LOC126424806 isoform X1 n=1 Tax=Schistocerca serialis cubense TaxID=2023355 RepID=UPI00214EADA6|nr:uncharacterized protein LOC126424806 isoform X1 [Schistocerca serialis cubense]
MPQCVKQPTGDLINHTLCVKSWLTLQCDPGVLPLSFRVQLFGANRMWNWYSQWSCLFEDQTVVNPPLEENKDSFGREVPQHGINDFYNLYMVVKEVTLCE